MKKHILLPLLYFIAGTAIVKGQVLTAPQTPWILEGNSINANPGGSTGSMIGDFFGSTNNQPLRFFILNDVFPFTGSGGASPVLNMDERFNNTLGIHPTLFSLGIPGMYNSFSGYDNQASVFGSGLSYSHGIGNNNIFHSDVGIGYSFLFGSGNKSTAWFNFSIGNDNINNGQHSHIYGEGSTANHANSFLIGASNVSDAEFNFTVGRENYNSGSSSGILGRYNGIYSSGSYVLGENNHSYGLSNYCMGSGNYNYGQGSLLLGLSNTSGTAAINSFVLGNNNNTQSENNVSIGLLNTNEAERSYMLGESNMVYAGSHYSYVIGHGNESRNGHNYSIGRSNVNHGEQAYLMGQGNSIAPAASNSLALGYGNQLSHGYNTAIGRWNILDGTYCYVLGESNTTETGAFETVVMGTENAAGADAKRAFAAGKFVKANSMQSFVFGTGTSTGAMLTNDIDNSLMVGFFNVPTFFVGHDAAVDKSKVGVGTTAPVTLFHNNGEATFGTYAARPAYHGLVNFNTEGYSNGIVIEDNGLASSASKASIKMDKVGTGPTGLNFSMTSNSFGSSTSTMFLADNGNVGFGLTEPVFPIHTRGQVAIGDYVSVPFYSGALNINDNHMIIERNTPGWSDIKAKIGISTYTGRGGLRFNMTRDGFTGSSGDNSWGTEALFLANDGMVGIGNTDPVAKLHISGDFCVSDALNVVNFKVYTNGQVRAREIIVDLNTIPDYVFKKDYKLLSINEYENFINANHHLPNIPSEAEYAQKGGVALGELELKLLEKVEEQALYIIALNKRLEMLEKQVSGK